MSVETNRIIQGDSRHIPLPDACVDLVCTSPPYYKQRNYKVDGQIGLEKTPEEWLDNILLVMAEVYRILKPTGSCYLNVGDKYGKDGLLQLPEQLSLRMKKEQGWILQNGLIWKKPGHMPSSIKMRYANSYEFFYFFTKSKKPLLWRNENTREWVDKRPSPMKYLQDGKVFDEYAWWCNHCDANGRDFKSQRAHVKETRSEGERHRTSERTPLWMGFESYFEMDAVREPHKESPEQMEYRRRLWEKRGKSIENQFGKETRYGGKFNGAGEEAESFGSPRARTQRVKDNVEHFATQGSGGHFEYGGLDSPEGKHYSAEGKAPEDSLEFGDVVTINGIEYMVTWAINGPRENARIDSFADHSVAGWTPAEKTKYRLVRLDGSVPDDIIHITSNLRNDDPTFEPGTMVEYQGKLYEVYRGRETSGGSRVFGNLGNESSAQPNFNARLNLRSLDGKVPEDATELAEQMGMEGSQGRDTANLYQKHTTHHKDGKQPDDSIEYPKKQDGVDNPRYHGFNERYRERGPNLDGTIPDDSVTISPEVRPKARIIGGHSNVHELRAQGQSFSWDVHPSKDPSWHHEDGKNVEDYWMINTQGNDDAMCPECGFFGRQRLFANNRCPRCRKEIGVVGHFAVFPELLCLRPILSSCHPNGIVFDPFMGLGTTALVCEKINKRAYPQMNKIAMGMNWNLRWIGQELNQKYIDMAYQRIRPFTTQPRLIEFASH